MYMEILYIGFAVAKKWRNADILFSLVVLIQTVVMQNKLSA